MTGAISKANIKNATMRRTCVPHALGAAHPSSRYWIYDNEINAMLNAIYCERWEQRDLNPPQRISSETAHQMGSFQDCNGSALQLVINLQQTHSSSFPCNWSPRYYQAILYSRVYSTSSIRPLLVGVLAFGVATSSCATSNVGCQFFSKHVNLASW